MRVSCTLRYRGGMCLYANIFLNQSLPTRHHTPRGRGQLLRGPRPLILSPRAALVDGRFRRRRFELAHRVRHHTRSRGARCPPYARAASRHSRTAARHTPLACLSAPPSLQHAFASPRTFDSHTLLSFLLSLQCLIAQGVALLAVVLGDGVRHQVRLAHFG